MGKIRLRNPNTIYLRVYILMEGSSHYYSTMFHNILVLVWRIERVTESNRKYQRVTVKTEKAEYGHVLTHAPSQRIGEIHNRAPPVYICLNEAKGKVNKEVEEVNRVVHLNCSVTSSIGE